MCAYVLNGQSQEGDAQLPGLGPVGTGKKLLVNHLGVPWVRVLCSLKISLTPFVRSQKPTEESTDA